MENHGDRDLSVRNPSPSGSNPPHLLYIGILLVLIIGLLAVLWTRERRLRVAAEQNVVNLRQENQTLRNAMGTIGAFRAPATQPGGP
ncbi:MAG: hypothetical protein QGH60_03220 [Phycisphaerae bacterium]|jgi:hypothetical protein|nr:hypothetical protein [Phycisphaerae bacterium]